MSEAVVMQSLMKKTKPIHFLLILCLVLQGTPFLEVRAQDRVRVENVRYEVFEEKIDVYYDLMGPANEEYEVTLSLRRESDKALTYTPKALVGDVGIGRFAGKDRKISWEIQKEFPKGLEGSDYYFVVDAKLISKGASPLLWIGAAVALGGGAAAYFLLTKKTETAKPEAGFPEPPGRPR